MDAETYAGKEFSVQGILPKATTIAMLCLDKERRCAGAEDVRRRLRKWPLARGVVTGGLVLVVPAALMLGAWWIDRRRRLVGSRDKID